MRTGAVVALLDADDRHHATLKDIYLSDPEAWILPWAILPEVAYLAGTHLEPTRRTCLIPI
jgi:predicted nucleic acid-binding protein